MRVQCAAVGEAQQSGAVVDFGGQLGRGPQGLKLGNGHKPAAEGIAIGGRVETQESGCDRPVGAGRGIRRRMGRNGLLCGTGCVSGQSRREEKCRTAAEDTHASLHLFAILIYGCWLPIKTACAG